MTTGTSTRAGRQGGAAALAVVALALAAGCGGEEAADPSCLSQAYNAAEAAAVAELYERGELGPKEDVQAQLSYDGMQFFDGDGGMIPYGRLSRAERNQLVAWFSNGPVSEETEAAREQAVDEADPDC